MKRYERLLDELDARVAHAGEAHVESRESRARAEKERRLDDLLRAASEAAEKAEKKADELREAKDAVEHVSTDPDFDSEASHDPLDEMMARRERRQDEDAREAENPFMKRLADGVARWNAEHGIETSQPAWAAGRAAQAAEERHEEHRKLRPQSSTETSETLSRLDDELRGFDVDVPDAKAEYDATLGQLDIDDDDDRDEGSAWDLDEVPEVDGIDGVIETAEAMGKVWAARQKLDAEAEAAEVAKKTKTRDVEPGLKLNRGREAYENIRRERTRSGRRLGRETPRRNRLPARRARRREVTSELVDAAPAGNATGWRRDEGRDDATARIEVDVFP